jgi:hypothetical protein
MKILASLLLILSVAFPCSATGITYDVNELFGPDSVTGFIQTDGATGVLGAGDIAEYDLLLTIAPFNTEFSDIGGLETLLPVSGDDLSATPTQLLFDFNGTDSGYLLLSAPGSAIDAVCWTTAGVDCIASSGGPGISFNIGLDSTAFSGESGTLAIGAVSAVGTQEPATFALLGTAIACLGLRKLQE